MINIQDKLVIDEFDGVIIPLFEDDIENIIMGVNLKNLKERELFKGKMGSMYAFTIQESGLVKNIVMLGLGKSENLSYRKLLNTFSNAVRAIKPNKVKSCVINPEFIELDEKSVKAISESVILGSYTFDKYKKKEEETSETDFTLVLEEPKKYKDVIKEGTALAKANIEARKLVNEPSNIMTPKKLAQSVVELAGTYGFEVEVLNESMIEQLGMEAFLSVAKASSEEPQFIIMRYNGDKGSDETLGLVGKGLTYDSGGLSIKPTASMVNMKSDMGGSAAVIGAMCAISSMGLKKNVTAVVAACENMIAGNAYRPGDIISSMGGKSIFIGNTDAEGRLTLIDAMTYIVEKEKVTKVVDIATLTGAALHCTGEAAAPVVSTDDNFFHSLQNAYDMAGELIWRMPVFDEYRELIKHEDADLTNTAGSPGTITAGLFIGEFTNNLPWIHIDIAGPSMAKKDNGFLSRGGTGCGTRPLYYLAKDN